MNKLIMCMALTFITPLMYAEPSKNQTAPKPTVLLDVDNIKPCPERIVEACLTDGAIKLPGGGVIPINHFNLRSFMGERAELSKEKTE